MEYSAKYRVSLSTLRRRIKSGELEHKLSDGKYLIKDSAPVQTPSSASASSVSPSPNPETIAPPTSVRSQGSGVDKKDEFWRTTQSLLNEIKKAYSLILQEKEEQILQLKEEVADLKTLVRVLEDDNQRMKNSAPNSSGSAGSSLDFDLGLEV